tara:strand:+ start:492 stop:1550 length:1059 start_codon:yes stop_codon:yes gene_type:complete
MSTNQENSEEENMEEEKTDELIEQTNDILENINQNFRRRARERLLANDLDLRNRLSRNSNNLDNYLQSRDNLRQQLEATRCNYLVNPETFCSRIKTNNSDYCIYHHSTTINGITPSPLIGRPRRGHNIYSIEDIRRQPIMIGVSSSSVSFDVTSSSDNVSIGITNNNDNNVSIGITNDNDNIVHHWGPNNNQSLSVTTADTSHSVPELNLLSYITRRSRYGRTGTFDFLTQSRDNLAELKEKKDKNGKCHLCQKTVYSPYVMLDCNHKYHLNCFMILNTNEDNKYELMEKCLKCGDKINMNLKEEKDCSICLEKLIDDDIEIELPCKHRFHIYCIQRWVDINKNCPLCRKTF